MHPADGMPPAGAAGRRRVFYFNAGFLRQKRIRRIMELAGHDLSLGRPTADDLVAVWGHSRFARRGEAVARRTGARLLRVEDAFLRSIFPGRGGEAPLGLVIDRRGMHYDGDGPSDLEHILASHPLDDTGTMRRARGAIARLKEAHLTKYSAVDPAAPCPDPGYVLVVDQTRGDASVVHGGAAARTFRDMLDSALDENPGARVLVKTHPETRAGYRRGYFGPEDVNDRVSLFTDPVSPWALMEGAVGVYTVSSQLGFEAILADHRPRVFGRPFYAGWNLTEDRHDQPFERRRRNLSRAQLFAAAMILYPTWYDPFHDRLCALEDVISILEARTRCWREDKAGWTAQGMRLWKRAPLQKFFGRYRRVTFRDGPGRDRGRKTMVWASRADAAPKGAVRVEDGFLRSRGLGAELVPPLSLVCDDLGIYYDPTRLSRLETLIEKRARLRPDQEWRAEGLIAALTSRGLSKYNQPGACPDLPRGRRILVPGQVEDDASIRLGAGTVATNAALLAAARADDPDAIILYKPHPDVAAGLRAGEVPPDTLARLADMVLPPCDPAAVLASVDEVWTMTSLIGFEALIRGVRVTVTGTPFYAGWGLTRDLGVVPARRRARPGLFGLVHASLIDYPRYFDPVTGMACPVEVTVTRLAAGTSAARGPANRLLSKLQGVFASHASLWR
ncbi:MAG: capsular polysaccharide biosynthesis protein [Roseovarius sp.]|nr:capsular polysaccharide biosynthesis protein [Roseovarius sp.]